MEQHSNPANNIKTMAIVAYGCWAAGLLSQVIQILGIFPLIALILALLKKKEAAGTIYESHFTWIIRTFIIGIIAVLIIIIAIFTVILAPIAVLATWALMLWGLWRLIKGGLRLYENKPIENVQSFF